MSTQITELERDQFELTAIARLRNGKFVRVVFIKQNGQERTIVGRTGVNKHVNGRGLSYDPAERGMIVIWETTKKNRRDEKDKGYRMVKIRSLIEFQADGLIFRTKVKNYV